MSSNSITLVVTKDFVTYLAWVEEKPPTERDKYCFVFDINTLNNHPEAPGLLIRDWANRKDAGEIYMWIQQRKVKRELEEKQNVYESAFALLFGNTGGV